MQCYFCNVSDPNEAHYDPKVHDICMICGVKLWELAQKRFEFDVRDRIVFVTTKNLQKATNLKRSVTLSTGYEVDLEDEDGLDHLFNAVFGEVSAHPRNTPGSYYHRPVRTCWWL